MKNHCPFFSRGFHFGSYLQPFNCQDPDHWQIAKSPYDDLSCQSEEKAPWPIFNSKVSDGSMNYATISEVAALLLSGIHAAAVCAKNDKGIK